MVKLLHAADLHLDSPFRSLPQPEAQRRRQEQRKALEALRDMALEHQVDLVLLAGDLFDSAQTYPETLTLLARLLGEMPCPVCIAPGNHDYWSETSPYCAQPWPSNVHIFTRETLEPLVFPDLGATVYGCAFTSPSRLSDPLAGFRAQGDTAVSIGLVHADVGGGQNYGPISPEGIENTGLSYLALGHIHKGTGLQKTGQTCWAYPGCLQGRGFDELGDKGALLVTLEVGVSARFLPIPGPRYHLLTAPVTGLDPALILAQNIPENHKNDYIRFTFTGESEGLDLAALRGAGAGLCRHLELRDETVLPQDLWARAEEETLTGLFLRGMRRRLDAAANETEKAAANLALRYGLAALEGREEPAGGEELE